MTGRGTFGLRLVALGYLTLLIAAPVAIMVWSTFSGGLGPVWEALTRPSTSRVEVLRRSARWWRSQNRSSAGGWTVTCRATSW